MSLGTGKTHLSIAFMKKFINAGIHSRYITEYQLLELYFQKKYDTFDNFRTAKLLVIDELGKRELQDWQKIVLEELISYRYNEQLPTIYITNMNEKEFKEFVGDRVVDRLRENGVIRATLVGESLRGKLSKKK
jgi:DNA replication protein DnaC